MKSIPTVTGDVAVDALGTTLMHEHIFVLTPDLQDTFPGFQGFDEEQAIADAQQKLRGLKAGGVDTIVDLTAPGLGRNVRRVAKAVEGTDLNVIVCTGFYTYHYLPFPMQYTGPGKMIEDARDDKLVDMFVSDIENGIEGTGIKAGILKCCTDMQGVTDDVERVLRAVARAHHRTDVPITTHTHAPTKRGLEQQKIFKEEGVDLTRVILGHSNETQDLDYLMEMMDAGSMVGFDRCGLNIVVELEPQLDTLAELCKRGYADRVVLSHDRHCTSDWFPEQFVLDFVPNWNYGYVQGGVIPGLQERGVTDEQVDQMTRQNPHRFFAASGAGTGGVGAHEARPTAV